MTTLEDYKKFDNLVSESDSDEQAKTQEKVIHQIDESSVVEIVFNKRPLGIVIQPDIVGNNCYVQFIDDDELIKKGLQIDFKIMKINEHVIETNTSFEEITKILKNELFPMKISFAKEKEVKKSKEKKKKKESLKEAIEKVQKINAELDAMAEPLWSWIEGFEKELKKEKKDYYKVKDLSEIFIAILKDEKTAHDQSISFAFILDKAIKENKNTNHLILIQWSNLNHLLEKEAISRIMRHVFGLPDTPTSRFIAVFNPITNTFHVTPDAKLKITKYTKTWVRSLP